MRIYYGFTLFMLSLFIFFSIQADAQLSNSYQEYTWTSSDGIVEKTRSVNGKIIMKTRTDNGDITITVYSEEEVEIKSFKTKEDFSAEDKTLYPQAWSELLGLLHETDDVSQKKLNFLKNSLQESSAHGFKVLSGASTTGQNTFAFFATSEYTDLTNLSDSLDTGIHETIHSIDNEFSGFHDHALYLMDQTIIKIPMNKLPRSVIAEAAKDFGNQKINSYAELYLEGSSSDQGFHMLLEELNAYTHGDFVGMDVSEFIKRKNSINEGLQIMMLFTELYLKHAHENNVEEWEKIKANAAWKVAIQSLWTQAEQTLLRACKSLYAPTEKTILSLVYAPEQLTEVQDVLGEDFNSMHDELSKACEIP